jgi:DNA-binding response OmpR family regulator
MLREEGHLVQETGNLADALAVVDSDAFDLLVLCHTIPNRYRKWFATQVMNKRRLIPIIYIQDDSKDGIPGCIAANKSAVSLLKAMQYAVPI